jgi:hypothetical protein
MVLLEIGCQSLSENDDMFLFSSTDLDTVDRPIDVCHLYASPQLEKQQ